jgi:hypothetical protein
MVCFALTAALIPMAVRLPLWIDFEIILAVWWLIWVAVLTRLLYLGRIVRDDHRLGEPRQWFDEDSRPSASGLASSWLWFTPFEIDGCVFALVVVAALVALVWAAWFVVEIAVPAVAFLLYFLMRAMLAQAINVEHGCRGKLGSALARSIVWATVYTAPLAGVVWLVHRLHGLR